MPQKYLEWIQALLRTNFEIGNTQSVLDGDLEPFIEASLKQGI